MKGRSATLEAEIAELKTDLREARERIAELERDRERLDLIFASKNAVINVRGPYDWDAVANRYELDAAMADERED